MPRSALYGELAELYDLIYAEKAYRDEATELVALARRFSGRRPRTLLDVGCGTGRHLGEFRRLGLAIAGVDASAKMLRVARKRLPRGTPLSRGDMRSFRRNGPYDVVTCLFSAIGYMRTRRDRDRALANIYRHVRPGGVALVVGWVLPERWQGGSVHLQTYDGPELKIARVTRSSTRGEFSILDMHYLIGRAGRAVHYVRERHVNPLVSSEEMLGSFRRAGFRARVLRHAPYSDRGLYVGVRPAESSRAPKGGHP